MSSPRVPSRATVIGRGLRGACPHCGGRGVFRSITELEDRCPTCGLSFLREDGYWVGAMTVIMALVLLVFGFFFVGGLLLTWPEVPWNTLLIGGILLNAVVPFALYGWAKTIWMGLDFAFNPAHAQDFGDEGDPN